MYSICLKERSNVKLIPETQEPSSGLKKQKMI